MATSNGKKPEEAIKDVPYGTPQWNKIRKQIVANLKKKYPGQFVLCIPGKIVEPEHMLHQNYAFGRNSSGEILSKLDRRLFTTDIKFEQRSDVEYNLDYKQVNVFAIIHDGEHMIVFRKANGEYSLPGGHVDFSLDAYRKSLWEFLFDAMLKELYEEITNVPVDYLETSPLAILNTTDGWNDLFHIGVMYECQVPDGTLSVFDIESNELSKHVVEIVSMEEVVTDSKYHPWAAHALTYSNHRQAILEKLRG